jgi:hypothetical protein
MPSEMISSMPDATNMENTDVLPIVQSGLNKKITRPILLTSPTGQTIALVSGTSTVEIDNTQDITISADLTNTISIDSGLISVLFVDGAGNVTLGPAGGTFNFGGSAGMSFQVDALGNTNFVVNDGVTLFITYDAAADGNWVGSPPPDIWTAIHRLAAAVSVGGTVPIP